MPLLVSHDSVILLQEGTEISVTIIIGPMIDIKYNHTFKGEVRMAKKHGPVSLTGIQTLRLLQVL